MSDDLHRVLGEAMKLTPEARAALVGSLLASLESEIDQDAEAEWAREIIRRLDEICDGKIDPMTWNTARRTLRGG
jgi:putative addiction module component (TIGR02574 family)